MVSAYHALDREVTKQWSKAATTVIPDTRVADMIRGDTPGVLQGYSRGTPGVLQGYSRGTLGVLKGYSRGTLGVLQGYSRVIAHRIRIRIGW